MVHSSACCAETCDDGCLQQTARLVEMRRGEPDATLHIGINGFGRLGRLVYFAAHNVGRGGSVHVAAINDPFIDSDYMCYMLRQDGLHGPFGKAIDRPAVQAVDEGASLILAGQRTHVFREREPKDVGWAGAGCHIVVEASGAFSTASRAAGHISGGASRVVMAAPCADAPTLIMGVNHMKYAGQPVVSNGTAATHCLAALTKAIDDAFGIEAACWSMLQAQSHVEIQKVQPGPSGAGTDSRSGKVAGRDVVPAQCEAVIAVSNALPHLAGRLGGATYRMLAASVSAVDFTCKLRSGADIVRM